MGMAGVCLLSYLVTLHAAVEHMLLVFVVRYCSELYLLTECVDKQLCCGDFVLGSIFLFLFSFVVLFGQILIQE